MSIAVRCRLLVSLLALFLAGSASSLLAMEGKNPIGTIERIPPNLVIDQTNCSQYSRLYSRKVFLNSLIEEQQALLDLKKPAGYSYPPTLALLSDWRVVTRPIMAISLQGIREEVQRLKRPPK